MNTRFLVTTKRWFGGGADLNPPIPDDTDTADFHAAFRQACEAHDADYYPRFKKWADDYFFIPHRGVHRGVGGIFYDHLEGAFDANFAFTKDVGEAFLRSDEHTSELQSLMRISYAVFCLNKKKLVPDLTTQLSTSQYNSP